MSSKEKDLLQRARKLDSEALGTIYDMYSDPLFAYAVRRVGNAQQAEDFVAETFSRFLKALKSGGGPEDHLQAYLYRITHNLITDHYRRTPPPPLELDEDRYSEEFAQPASIVANKMRAEQIRRALQHLTPGQQQVILLKYVEGFSNQEIAETMDKTVGAVKSQAYRAVASLQRLLVEDEDES
jgi:RNA polymerase sigma-70 factor (ECF subfamily)